MGVGGRRRAINRVKAGKFPLPPLPSGTPKKKEPGGFGGGGGWWGKKKKRFGGLQKQKKKCSSLP